MSTLETRIAEVVSEHIPNQSIGTSTGRTGEEAEAQFDRAIAKVRAEAKREALREAADKFQTGDWFNVIEGNAHVKIGNGQRVTDWLRARADKLVTE